YIFEKQDFGFLVPEFFNDADDVKKQQPAFIFEAAFFSGNRKRLAWKARRQDVHRPKQIAPDRQIFNRLVEITDAREIQLKSFCGEFVLFIRPRNCRSRFLERAAETANRGKEIANADRFSIFFVIIHASEIADIIGVSKFSAQGRKASWMRCDFCRPSGAWGLFERLNPRLK